MIAIRIWHSPTFMTWGSISVRLIGLTVLLPLALRILTTEEAGLWLLFSAITGLLTLVDFGFQPTFIRAIAYIRAEPSEGMAPDATLALPERHDHAAVIATMKYIYLRIGIGVFILGGICGTLALINPIAKLEDHAIGWASWAYVLVTVSLTLRLSMYAAYLQGSERIATFRRWEILSGFVTLVVALITLSFGGGLLGLVVAYQTGSVLTAMVNRLLAHAGEGRVMWKARGSRDEAVWEAIWPSAWRSGLGVLLSFGTVQGTGVIYSQIGDSESVASYLLALRLMTTLVTFANIPFYVRIPKLSRLYAAGDITNLQTNARVSMIASTWTMLAGCLMIGFLGPMALSLIGSNTPFVLANVWWLLAVANIIHRVGAMHLQLYTVTNHVVWHIADGISGVIILLIMQPLFGAFGLAGLPLAILIGYAGFYLPFSVNKAYRRFNLKFGYLDFISSAIPIISLVSVLVLAMYGRI